jgi:hypothetical protein
VVLNKKGESLPMGRQSRPQGKILARCSKSGKAKNQRLPDTPGRGSVDAIVSVAAHVAQVGADGEHKVFMGFFRPPHFARCPGMEARPQ